MDMNMMEFMIGHVTNNKYILIVYDMSNHKN